VGLVGVSTIKRGAEGGGSDESPPASPLFFED